VHHAVHRRLHGDGTGNHGFGDAGSGTPVSRRELSQFVIAVVGRTYPLIRRHDQIKWGLQRAALTSVFSNTSLADN
jgi:hypothetical protein